jgi:chromosomal replication initiator protein
MDARQLWENVLVDIELSVSKATFSTWFKGTHIARYDEGVVTVGVPSQFHREWLFEKHVKTILRALRNFVPEVRSVEFAIVKDGKGREGERKQIPRAISLNELPLAEHYVSRTDNLNPRYIFDTFVVGPFNELAYAAAQAIVAEPGITYNPLFIYGNTGLGKTHLIQAIGNQLKKTNPSRKILYVTSEKFGSDYVNALQNNSVQQSKERYRQYDVLIMDDIQFLAGKEKMQEELFHLFNTLYQNNKQIVFSSDKHPNYIQNLEDRLKSRFAQGMIIDVNSPDHESRMAILRTKAAQNSVTISDEMIEFLASSIEGNIRELEGVLNRVICQTQLKGVPLTVVDLKNLIKDTAKPQKTVSVKEVVRRVAEYYDIEESSIYEKTRKKEVVKPRQLIMYIMREDFSISYPAIGEKLGKRDHTTVIHSCEKIKNELLHDTALVQELEQIRTLLK